MIHILITSYNEPNATVRAVRSFLQQPIPDDYKIIVVDPFAETEHILKKNISSDKVSFFLDPDEGKSYALNLLFQEYGSSNKEDLFILSDGDVYVSDNAVQEICAKFNDPTIGCVTGKPVSLDSRNTKYGYWSHVLFEGIDRVRRDYSNAQKFFECSGYLFAIRKGVIFDFPMETSEDSILPYLFWKKGFTIAYADKAEVYVKNPNNWEDMLTQKVRNIKAHENLGKIVPDMPRTKSLINEIKKGTVFALSHPKNPQELWWTAQLFGARLYIYLKAFSELRKGTRYKDGWRETEIESTKPLD